jgi:hypothetical protein
MLGYFECLVELALQASLGGFLVGYFSTLNMSSPSSFAWLLVWAQLSTGGRPGLVYTPIIAQCTAQREDERNMFMPGLKSIEASTLIT